MRGYYTTDPTGTRHLRASDKDAEERPQVIVSPETPASAEDIRAIVQAVALRILQNEIDYHGLEELTDYHPALQGISLEQLQAVIDEGLA